MPPNQAIADASAQRVLRQFRQIFNAVTTHFRKIERKVGLGGAQVWALSVIQGAPGSGIRTLASTMNIHQSTASNLVKSLVSRGLVEVTRDLNDRRAVQLRLLPEGRKVLRRSPRPVAGVLPEALAALSPKALGRIEADLEALIAVLKVDEKAGKRPLADL